ncbi:MAG: sulfur transferase domain-containing protein [bacterium]|nr:sulfur transferase domain-containing protein [bacterium]
MKIALLLALVLGLGSWAHAGSPEAPFGDKVSGALLNYNRASPFVASSGVLGKGGVAEVKALGFKTIVDLRAPSEGIAEEKAEAEAMGLRYINIPVSTAAPTNAQVAAFAKIVENPANYPILFHCQSANRTGAMWALYRFRKGVPPAVAVEEGRTLGLKSSREKAVRLRLGLSPASK